MFTTHHEDKENESTYIIQKLDKKMERLAYSFQNEDRSEKFRSEMKGFRDIYSNFIEGRTKPIQWERINDNFSIPEYMEINSIDENRMRVISSKLAVLKLNGGLGTTMKCNGPKSIIEVRSGETFLDIIHKQIEHLNNTNGSNIPLVLMNSFNTSKETRDVIRKYEQSNVPFMCFEQSQYPRIFSENFMPVPNDMKKVEKDEWYPPGHGDIYQSIINSGTLEKLKKEGREYLFISNVDNLGATVDMNILNYMIEHDYEFLMEVTDKTEADVKGGTLIEYEGKIKLLEIAQVPKEHLNDFTSVKKFKVFNTNNLWVKLSAIEKFIENGNFSKMDVIKNPKKLKNGSMCIQLETAAGAAIEHFRSTGLIVPRSRFMPVKKTSDLFLVQSDLYSINPKNKCLILNPLRTLPTLPIIKLGEYFSSVQEFQNRFKSIPKILELSHLTVSGDVSFGENITLKGSVVVVAHKGNKIDVPSGSVLENSVLTGNLRIVEH
eukprot:TRINITY_DN1847_c0_g1_i3.p1 TRINITY_DN1847_c0_g1~~TRINITY_DN1847_c0_g1_i3.p1  ORF type:complete len:491 (-),score=149.96 TRINITY_DN1847_c0_g1_i3:39-1511(-)